MTSDEKNNFFYVCSMIEYTARRTKNHRRVIVEKLQKKGIEKQLYDAQVNHCLSYEQVSDEISDFRTGLYYQNPDYLKCSYQEGRLLDQDDKAELEQGNREKNYEVMYWQEHV